MKFSVFLVLLCLGLGVAQHSFQCLDGTILKSYSVSIYTDTVNCAEHKGFLQLVPDESTINNWRKEDSIAMEDVYKTMDINRERMLDSMKRDEPETNIQRGFFLNLLGVLSLGGLLFFFLVES